MSLYAYWFTCAERSRSMSLWVYEFMGGVEWAYGD